MRLPLIVTALVLATAPAAAAFEPRSLDGSGNNVAHPEWGRAGVPYVRVAPARYGDGIASQARGPSPRYEDDPLELPTRPQPAEPEELAEVAAEIRDS